MKVLNKLGNEHLEPSGNCCRFVTGNREFHCFSRNLLPLSHVAHVALPVCRGHQTVWGARVRALDFCYCVATAAVLVAVVVVAVVDVVVVVVVVFIS